MNKKILLNVDYVDNTGKFWQDSYIKNKIFPLIENDIDKTVKKALEDLDGMELSYNGKPQQNIYIDLKNGSIKQTGYIYRTKNEIDGKKVCFDAWVTINEIIDFPLKDIDN